MKISCLQGLCSTFSKWVPGTIWDTMNHDYWRYHVTYFFFCIPTNNICIKKPPIFALTKTLRLFYSSMNGKRGKIRSKFSLCDKLFRWLFTQFCRFFSPYPLLFMRFCPLCVWYTQHQWPLLSCWFHLTPGESDTKTHQMSFYKLCKHVIV